MQKELIMNIVSIGWDGFVRAKLPAELDPVTAQTFADEFVKIFNANPHNLSIIDASDVKSIPTDSVKKVLVDGLKRLRPTVKDRTAIILQIDPFLKIAVRAILIIIGKTKTQIFSSEDEARAWLSKYRLP